MQRIQRLFRFPSPITEATYQQCKRQQTQNPKKLIIIALAMNLFAIVQSTLYESYSTIISTASISLPLLLFLIFLVNKTNKVSRFLISLVYFGLYISIMYDLRNYLSMIEFSDLIYAGYAFAGFERIIIPELTRLDMKIAFSIGGIIARLLLFSPLSAQGILSQVILLILGIIIDIWNEKDNRCIFEQFYNVKEESKKLKNLVFSSLFSSLIILSESEKSILYSSDNFDGFFYSGDHKKILLGFDPLKWLEKLLVDPDSVDKFIREALEEDDSHQISLMEIVNLLCEKKLLTEYRNSISCFAKLEAQDMDSKRKIFSVCVSRVVWKGKNSLAITLNDITEQYSLKISAIYRKKIPWELASICHEWRAPLNGLAVMLEMITKQKEKQMKDESIQNYLAICKNSVKMLFSLVNSMMDLNRLQTGKWSMVIESGNLEEFLKKALSLFHTICSAKGLFLRLDIAREVSRDIRTDLNRLELVLYHLLHNATKFTIQGGITIFVNKDTRREDYVQFNILDTGIGMMKEDIMRIKNFFKQEIEHEEDFQERRFEIGLVLSELIVRKLCSKEMDEGLAIESQSAGGSSFSFCIKNQRESSDSANVSETDDDI